mmetsp:Transcript_87548/g.120644  ORF Transcript_87548/g.120644 Transcript_87548/m.120644 type:complete len:127 (-) Transcript_87548:461-841(-)
MIVWNAQPVNGAHLAPLLPPIVLLASIVLPRLSGNTNSHAQQAKQLQPEPTAPTPTALTVLMAPGAQRVSLVLPLCVIVLITIVQQAQQLQQDALMVLTSMDQVPSQVMVIVQHVMQVVSVCLVLL